MNYDQFINIVDDVLNYQDKAMLLCVFFGMSEEDIKALTLSDIKTDSQINCPSGQVIRLGSMAKDSDFEKCLIIAEKETIWHYKNGLEDNGLKIRLPEGNGRIFKSLDVIDKSIDERLMDIGELYGLREHFTFESIKRSGYYAWETM